MSDEVKIVSGYGCEHGNAWWRITCLQVERIQLGEEENGKEEDRGHVVEKVFRAFPLECSEVMRCKLLDDTLALRSQALSLSKSTPLKML
jgi:hypothetical protein